MRAPLMRIGATAGLCLFLAHCADSKVDPRYGVSASPRLVDEGQPIPKGGGFYRVGAPYVVGGQVYVPEENPHYRAVGLASWYGEDFHGRATANGEIYDLNSITAAHPTMPLPSYARVTNLANRHSLIVRVNDRGPYHADRIIDVSKRAAELLGFHRRGTAWVQVEYIGRAPMEGSDDRLLEATLRENKPAPDPRTIKLARLPMPTVVSSLPRDSRLASASEAYGAPIASFVEESHPDEILTGRGLY